MVVNYVDELFAPVYKYDPIGFCYDVLNVDLLWSGQRRILEAYNKHKRCAFPSGHSTGKTGTEAFIILHWLSTRKNSRVICTAPTYRQLEHVLYAEITKWYNNSDLKPLDMFAMKRGLIHINDEDLKKLWYTLFVSPKNPDSLQGQHGDKSQMVKAVMKELGITEIRDDDTIETVVKKLKEGTKDGEGEDLLIIIEEASGVPMEILEVLEGTDYGKLLMFGNMTKTSGMFYDSVYSAKSNFHVERLSSYDSPFMSNEQIEYMEERYGKDSNVVKVRLKGEAPSGEDDTVIERAEAEACIGITVDENQIPAKFLVPRNVKFVSDDVARFGKDKTQIYEREKYEMTALHTLSKKDTMQSVGIISNIANNYLPKYMEVRIDTIGVGGGVYDRLNELKMIENKIPNAILIEFHNNGVPNKPDEYLNLITEGYFEIQERIKHRAIVIPNDPELIEDLCARRYLFHSSGKIYVESKDDFKERIKRSPDKGDSFIMNWKRHQEGSTESSKPEGW